MVAIFLHLVWEAFLVGKWSLPLNKYNKTSKVVRDLENLLQFLREKCLGTGYKQAMEAVN